ncbi:FAD/NAD(P)-binding domain-containing protein [Thozetella sp. PMI_491]|nr:FAD/NAD(P)-binding domain-containing protein [Thozetella sp. PMI_491]
MLPLLAPVLLALSATASASRDCDLETDVLVVGGGSTGTYASVKLHDLGKTVLLVEKTGVLGGHVNTYTDPVTGNVTNVGVQSFHNTSTARAYFDRLGVALGPGSYTPRTTIYPDWRLGELSDWQPPSQQAQGVALQNYLAFLKATAPDLDLGWDHLGFPVHEDLLLTFGEAAVKYNFTDCVHLINAYNQPGSATNETAAYAAKVFGIDLTEAVLAGTLLATHDVEDLYRAATKVLGKSVLFESNLTHVQRSPEGVRAIVQTPTGPKTIKAKKILNTAYPLLSNLEGWDLSANERNLFGKFNGHSYFAAVLKTKAAGQNINSDNIGSSDPFGIPTMPGVHALSATTFPDTHLLYYGANTIISTEEAQANVRADFQRLADNGVFLDGEVEFLAWYDHTPTRLFASAEDVRAGFYEDLFALQGVSNTWWSGAAWQAQDSSLIWEFTSRLVDRMLT